MDDGIPLCRSIIVQIIVVRVAIARAAELVEEVERLGVREGAERDMARRGGSRRKRLRR